jgi:hypothetical protein
MAFKRHFILSMVVMVDGYAVMISQHDFMRVLCMHRYTQMARPSDETMIKHTRRKSISKQSVLFSVIKVYETINR